MHYSQMHFAFDLHNKMEGLFSKLVGHFSKKWKWLSQLKCFKSTTNLDQDMVVWIGLEKLSIKCELIKKGHVNHAASENLEKWAIF
jgi:hypothetical protein